LAELSLAGEDKEYGDPNMEVFAARMLERLMGAGRRRERGMGWGDCAREDRIRGT
jgi:hypothetical protein